MQILSTAVTLYKLCVGTNQQRIRMKIMILFVLKRLINLENLRLFVIKINRSRQAIAIK